MAFTLTGRTKGPWLHSSTLKAGLDDFPLVECSNLLTETFPALYTPEAAQRYLEGVANLSRSTNSGCHDDPSQAIQDWIVGDPHVNASRVIRDWITKYLTPLVTFDIVMYAAETNRQLLVSPMDRAHARPTYNAQMNKHLANRSDWCAIISDADTAFTAMANEAQRQKPLAPGDRKGEYLKWLYGLAGKGAGERALHNIRTVTFALGFYLHGNMDHTENALCTYTIKHAEKTRGVTLTAEDWVRPNDNSLLSPLWACMAHTPLSALFHDLNLSANVWKTMPLFCIWQASGSTLRCDFEHPLTMVERIMWKLLIRAALQEITDWQVMDMFLKHPEVIRILRPDRPMLPLHAQALRYPQQILEQDGGTLIPIQVEDEDLLLPIALPEASPVEDPRPVECNQAKPTGSGTKRKSDGPAEGASPKRVRQDKVPPAVPIPLSAKTRSQTNSLPAPSAPLTPAPMSKPIRSAGKHKATAKTTVQVSSAPAEAPSNLLVRVYGPEHAFAQQETEYQVIEAAFQEGKVLELDQELPFAAEPLMIEYWEPQPDGSWIKRTFEWKTFASVPSDRTTFEEMKATELKGQDDLPLYCQKSARNLDPTLKPSRTQSLVAVALKHEYLSLSEKDRHELHRHRCVLILDAYQDPIPPFNRATLSRFRHLEDRCEIQDPGLRKEVDGVIDEDIVRIGKLGDLLDKQARGGEVVLNALQNPMGNCNIPVPPGWSEYATHERAANHTRSIQGVPPPIMPSDDLRWVIIANKHAKSCAHQDVLSTSITLLVGWKLWALAVPLQEGPGPGDFSSRKGFQGWDAASSNKEFLRWEFIALGPNMTFYQRAGTPHHVISMANCIGWGHHGHCAAALSPGIWCALHNIIAGTATTNADHTNALHLLIRIFLFQARDIVIHKERDVHTPDIAIKEQLYDLVNLACFVILYPALNTKEYWNMGEDNVLPMSQYQFDEMAAAWDALSALVKFVDEQSFVSTIYASFQDMLDAGVIHMAVALERYKKGYEGRQKVQHGFTYTAFTLQLVRTLAAYESHRLTHNKIEVDPAAESRLASTFQMGMTSREKYERFVPWTAENMPCDIEIAQ
ncbi:hypothetical protein DFH07DRAFT_1059140 [Mycena maculata]|uniref:Uncharacterized protein n=1 Tax=Mycena maculata TaxID=230809 RepID=A0AAD7JGP8_9AGAR|nr:hypothetical protein DFH07DRAFT_1059140 [Mycena maculata]